MLLTVRLFGLLTGLGASIGLWRVYRASAPADALKNLVSALFVLIGALAGGRGAYIMVHRAYFAANPELGLRFWLGGFNGFGALAGWMLCGVLASLVLKRRVSGTLDLMSRLLLPLGVAIWLGLWGDGVAYGRTMLAGQFGALAAPDEGGLLQPRFPLQLVAALSLAAVLWLTERFTRGSKPGVRFGWTGLLLSVHTALICWFRADPAPVLAGLRQDFVTALGFAIGFVLILVLMVIRKSNQDRIERRTFSGDDEDSAVKKSMEENMVNLTIDTDEVRQKLTGFIREELAKAGFDKIVLGLSGGLDSTLACYLAVEALGPDNVLAVRMPYRTSSQGSLDHARLVIDALGVQNMTIPITAMVEPLFEQIPDMDGRRRGNVMARERMIILFDRSEAFKGLVLGTGNKTEYLLGYTTLYGDSACALNPLGDLYKTQVRQLSRAMGVPEEIIAKPPSADLWVGQTDEGELGFTYAEVDRLLCMLVDEGFSPEACVESGFTEDFVRKVIRKVRNSQFKRVLPPIAMLNDSPNNYDFLLLPERGG